MPRIMRPVETWAPECIRSLMPRSIIANALRLLAAAVLALPSACRQLRLIWSLAMDSGSRSSRRRAGSATKFYPHPYSFLRPIRPIRLSEGIETANFIKTLGWGASGQPGIADYVDGFACDPNAPRRRQRLFLHAVWARAPGADRQSGGRRAKAASWRVEWNRPFSRKKVVGRSGAKLLRFEGIDEPLLLIPLGRSREKLLAGQPLAASSAWALDRSRQRE